MRFVYVFCSSGSGNRWLKRPQPWQAEACGWQGLALPWRIRNPPQIENLPHRWAVAENRCARRRLEDVRRMQESTRPLADHKKRWSAPLEDLRASHTLYRLCVLI